MEIAKYETFRSVGTFVGEDQSFSDDWGMVNCKRCLKNKDKINKGIEEDEANIVKQMGDFVDFCNKTESSNKAHIALKKNVK